MAKVTKPPHAPTDNDRETVASHALAGTTQATIAEILGIDVKTLRKYYRAELNTAMASANAKIGGLLYAKATNGDTAAMIFWLKTRARWRETGDDVDKLVKAEQAKRLALENKLLELRVQAAEKGHALGGDITVVFNQTPYTDEELAAIRAEQENNV